MQKKCKLLVSGGAGFIGSEFIRQAVASGYKVVVVDNLSYAGDKKRLASVWKHVAFYAVDICSQAKLRTVFQKEKPTAVVHFAAETHVDRSILGSTPFIQTNIAGTQHLLDLAREYEVEKFVHVSTDEVYGDIEKGQFYEHTPFNPSSPYSASKAAADMLVKSYVRTFNFPAVILRPSNNYGPWQYPEKFLPVIIYNALNDRIIPVYGKGVNVREWLYVSDCARAVMCALSKGKPGSIYNVGSGCERRNIDVVKTVLHIMGKSEGLIQFVKDRPGHDIRYSLNSRKIHSELKWKPQMTFVRGMENTIAWYCDNQSWLNSTVAALKDYWKKVYKKA